MPAITPRTVVSDALRAVGGNTGALQKIYIWYEGRLYQRALQQLASANMQLENINFEFVETKLFNHVAYIVDIFEAFSVCPLLKSIHVELILLKTSMPQQKVPAIAEACVKFRSRKMSVTVDEVRYL